MRLVAAAVCLAGSLLPAACEPCSGTAQCVNGTYLAADGQIVDAGSGRGVDGVRIDVTRRGGIAVDRDSVSTVTAKDGHWRVQFTPATGGNLDVDVNVTAPTGASYRVRNLRLSTTERGGEGNLLERWVADPYFAYAFELFVRGTTDDRVVGAAVDFRRTAGIDLLGPGVANGAFHATSDFAGRVSLFSPGEDGVFTSAVGDVVGDLIVKRSPSDSTVVTGLHIRSTYIYRDSPGIFRLGVGPSLEYQGEFRSRATGALLGGVQVDFQRTGGVEVTVPNFTTTSAANGRFSFAGRPLTAGTLQGRLIFRAPLPATPETLSVRLQTFEDDGGRFFGVIGAGAYLPYYGIVLDGRGQGIDGVKVTVTRVSGIGIAPDPFTAVSYNGGIFIVQPAPLALGEVTVDLAFLPPAPYAPFTVRALKLATADRKVDDRLIGLYFLP